ncbi:MAG TPA: protein phosphatase 2C domain-containing protein [Pirellulales bacterium]|nr:protein phosphatase 2C domain-containing protein [Pirellulales bacterium]
MILDTFNLPQAHRQTAPGKIECFGLTDRGYIRDLNEDQFLVADLRKSLDVHHTSLGLSGHNHLTGDTHGQLLLVADGLGGHASGERASTLAVDCLTRFAVNAMHWCARLDDCDDERVFAEWEEALQLCDEQVHAEGNARPESHGMGTTLTLAYVAWPNAYILHAGDSRCYLLRNGRLEQITTDHTLAQKFIDAGMITPDQAGQSRFSHVLWNAIGGTSDRVSTEAHKLALEMGDVLLLCTDGLTNEVDDATLAEMLSRPLPAADVCRELVTAAKEAGGNDNITVVVARFVAKEQAGTSGGAGPLGEVSLYDTVDLDEFQP